MLHANYQQCLILKPRIMFRLYHFFINFIDKSGCDIRAGIPNVGLGMKMSDSAVSLTWCLLYPWYKRFVGYLLSRCGTDVQILIDRLALVFLRVGRTRLFFLCTCENDGVDVLSVRTCVHLLSVGLLAL